MSRDEMEEMLYFICSKQPDEVLNLIEELETRRAESRIRRNWNASRDH